MIRNVDRNGNDIDLTKVVLTRDTHPMVFQIMDRMNQEGGEQNVACRYVSGNTSVATSS